VHSYLASLRISGDPLNIREISSELGIEPTQVRIKGQPRTGKKDVWGDSMWEYEVRHDGKTDWPSLEDALLNLLSNLSSKRKILRRYQRQFRVCIFCGHFFSSFNGGPTFSPSLLKKLGDLEIELFIDTYSRQSHKSPSKPTRKKRPV
jgi:hypothetical protein